MVKDTLKDLLKNARGLTTLYRCKTCHGTSRSPPFWIASLCRVKTSGIVETLMPPSHHSFLSSSYPSPPSPITFFLSFIRSRTLAHAAWPTWPWIGPVYSSAFRPMCRAADLPHLNFTIFYASLFQFTLQLSRNFSPISCLHFIIALAMRANVVDEDTRLFKQKVSLIIKKDLKNLRSTFSRNHELF